MMPPPMMRSNLLEVVAQQVVVHHLTGRRPGVRERAGRQDAVIDAGVGVGDPVLRQRAAGAARADREAHRAVLLDHALLGHQQRLGLGGDVAVVAGVVGSGGHHRKAAAERLLTGVERDERDRHRVVLRDAGRTVHAVGDVAIAAVRDQQLVRVLRLRRVQGPRFAWVEQRGDLVLVTRDVAGLDADDERHRGAVLGGDGRNVTRLVLEVVALQADLERIGGLVLVRVGRLLVALPVHRLLLAFPRLDLRAGEDGAALRVIGDLQRRARVIGQTHVDRADTDLELGDQPLERRRAGAAEQPRHFTAVTDADAVPPVRGPLRQRDPHEGVTAGDEVRPRGEDRDDRGIGGRISGCRGQRSDCRESDQPNEICAQYSHP